MPGLVAIRDALSSQVVKRLAAAGYPPLVDGKILFGKQQQFAQTAPPRILMTPLGSAFGAVNTYSNQPVVVRGVDSEARRQVAQRSVQMEFVRFEVRCWGTSTSSDPTKIRDDDYDMTQSLYQAFIQACCAPSIDDGGPAVLGPFTAGGVELESGAWTDATFAGGQLTAFGREFVFGLRVPTPILDRLLAYAPADVRAKPSSAMTSPDGTSSAGCGG